MVFVWQCVPSHPYSDETDHATKLDSDFFSHIGESWSKTQYDVDFRISTQTETFDLDKQFAFSLQYRL